MAKRQPSSRTATTATTTATTTTTTTTTITRKRTPRQPASEPARRYLVMPELPPMPTPEQIAADAARRARPPRPRPPKQCTVGCGFDARDRPVPSLRLGGHWLEQLGFAIGSKLRIAMREGELVVSVATDG